MAVPRNKLRKHEKWELSESTLQAYRQLADGQGIGRNLRKLPNAGSAVTRQRKNANRRIRAFFNQLWNITVASGEKSGCLFLLVDPDGCQIMTRGDELLRREGMEIGICDGAVWRMDASGPSALSIGLAENRSVTSEGSQNYVSALSPYMMCFAPLHIDRTSLTKKLGGVALVTRAGMDRDLCQTLLGMLAADLILHYENSLMISQGYQTMETGMVWLDINTQSKETAIVHHNHIFFEVLGLSPEKEDLYFTPLRAYIDPLPYNRQFWDILNQAREVQEQELQLVIGGRRRNVIMSTTIDDDSVMGTRSILLRINTRSRMTKAISEKTANSAIMTFGAVIGSSPAMQNAICKAKILAGTESNVLLYGESGVGKDVFAQAIHNASERRNKPFVAVNCGALPRELIESELFGYEGGAFTGAKKQGNIGKFELANGGTLFLDEIGELPLDLQATLLRAVEQKSFMRVGSNRLIDVDVKIISATNANIPQMIEEKRFRMDLYYRLGTMYLQIPPLRARGRDIVQLAEYFIASICRRTRRSESKVLSPEAADLLCSLPWRGNVRELQNLMECLVQLYPDKVITGQQVLESLSPLGTGNVDTFPAFPAAESVPGGRDGQTPLTPLEGADETEPEPQEERAMNPAGRDARGLLTREAIQRALDECGGNRSKAARRLGIARKTFYRNMERLGM